MSENFDSISAISLSPHRFIIRGCEFVFQSKARAINGIGQAKTLLTVSRKRCAEETNKTQHGSDFSVACRLLIRWGRMSETTFSSHTASHTACRN